MGGLTSAVAAQATPPTTADSAAARRLHAVQVTEPRAPAVVGGATAVVMQTGKLRGSPAPLLNHVLRESPFVHVRQNSRGETELSVRGSDSRQATILLDGVPMSLGWDHRADPSLIPMTGAEQLVIVRGLGSVLGGPNALGGTISISQGPLSTPAGTRAAWAGVGVDRATAFVLSLGADRTVAARSGTVTMRAGVSHRDRDGFALPGGATDPTSREGLRTNSDLRETDAFASARWKDPRGRFVGLTATGFSAERGVAPEEHLSAPRLWRYPDSKRAVIGLAAGTGPFTTRLGTGALELSSGLNAGHARVESFTDRTYRTVNGRELGDERTTSARALLTHSLPRGASLGVSWTRADVRYIETLAPAAGVRYRQILTSTAAEVALPVGAHTSVSLGAAFDGANAPESGGRESAPAPFDDLGWRAGLTHELSDAWRLSASTSSRARFPSLRELYSGALNRFRPNPDLKPETLLGIEGGVTYRGALGDIPQATVQMTAFRHHLSDAVVRITLSDPTRFMRVNRDAIESLGLEGLLGLTFGNVRDQSVTLDGDFSVQRITIRDQTALSAERHSENNPELRGSATLGFPLAYGMRGFGSARHAGVQYCLNVETGAEVNLAATTVTDLSLERSFSLARGVFRSLRALVAADNVANTTAFDQCGLAQPGRTLRVMLSLR
ncbi:MAG: TonB-dependent receptor [Gemmatimonadota bacterium]|nr:TonB-dependent receptor [Gemmatimonadota bacterium]